MTTYDLIIKGGTVVDGTRVPRYKADVAIANGRVAYIGETRTSDGARILDAEGLIVAPGFLDLHTHYDSQIFWDPHCTISGYHGVTSVVIGNCGFGFAPCTPDERERAMLSLSRNEAVPLKTMQAGMPWDWETFPEYLDSLERTPKGVNVTPYIGLTPVISYVMGGMDKAKERPATESELNKMCEILYEAVSMGACGFSTQMFGDVNNPQRDYDGTPMVTDTRSLEEVAIFAKAMGRTGRGTFQVAGQAMKAAEVAARESRRPVLYNVLSPSPGGLDQHGFPTTGMEETMAWMDRLNAEGLRVYGQAVTNPNTDVIFTLEDYNLFDGSPLWLEATLGGPTDRLRKLSDPQRRAAMKAEYDQGTGGLSVSRIGKMTLRRVPDDAPQEMKRLAGTTIGEIATRDKKHVVDVFLEIACGTSLRAEFETTFSTPVEPEMMRDLVRYQYALPGISDGGAHTKFFTTGNFTTYFLTEWVRKHEFVTLEEAHWRLSGYPAFVAGIGDRGYIREGAAADIVVYDFENLNILPAERTYDFPADEWRLSQKADGYRYTIVNGEVTFIDSKPTEVYPGRLLRHGADIAVA